MAGDGNSSSRAASKDAKSDSDANGSAKSKASTPTTAATSTHPPASATEPIKSPRKRRKVNHGMLCIVAEFSYRVVFCSKNIPSMMRSYMRSQG